MPTRLDASASGSKHWNLTASAPARFASEMRRRALDIFPPWFPESSATISGIGGFVTGPVSRRSAGRDCAWVDMTASIGHEQLRPGSYNSDIQEYQMYRPSALRLRCGHQSEPCETMRPPLGRCEEQRHLATTQVFCFCGTRRNQTHPADRNYTFPM